MALLNRNQHGIIISSVRRHQGLDDNLAHVASTSITPGMLIERHLDSGSIKWRPHSADTRQATTWVADYRPELNKTITDAYAAGDTVRAVCLLPGDLWNAIIPSGQDIAQCDLLQSNGDGKLKEATAATAAANVWRFTSLSGPGSVTADTRITAEVL